MNQRSFCDEAYPSLPGDEKGLDGDQASVDAQRQPEAQAEGIAMHHKSLKNNCSSPAPKSFSSTDAGSQADGWRPGRPQRLYARPSGPKSALPAPGGLRRTPGPTIPPPHANRSVIVGGG